jgi:hypothetical protein
MTAMTRVMVAKNTLAAVSAQSPYEQMRTQCERANELKIQNGPGPDWRNAFASHRQHYNLGTCTARDVAGVARLMKQIGCWLSGYTLSNRGYIGPMHAGVVLHRKVEQ